jgi:hypothetical protein
MTYFERFITFFNEYTLENGYKELEIKLLLDHNVKYPNFVKKPDGKISISFFKSLLRVLLNNNTVEVKQTINFISSNTNHSSYIKELVFKDGEQLKDKKNIYKKTGTHPPIFLCNNAQIENLIDFKISFNIEEPSSESADFDLIRFKFRFSFRIEHWNIDMTLIKSSTSKEISVIKTIKEKLFCSNLNTQNIFTEQWIWKYIDAAEIEFEYNNIGPFQEVYIKDVYTLLKNINSEKNIPHLLHYIIYADNKCSQKDTLKKVLPGVIEINKKQYFTEILPDINNFYITDKADGTRVVLFVGEGVYYYDNNIHIIEDAATFKNTTSDYIAETIMECEKIGDLFYAYDIFQFKGLNVAKQPFHERLQYLHKITWKNLRIKEFISLDQKNYAEQITQFYEKSLQGEYEIDGLIFTSKTYDYKNTRFYKWKPVQNMTIDFVARKCPSELTGISPYDAKPNKTLYLLFSGINSNEFKKLGLAKIQYYTKLFSYTDHQYFPIQFSPSDYPNAYIWYSDSPDLDNKIVELSFDKKRREWSLFRIRTDRKEDLEKKYYGNSFKVAEIIWRNFSNPLLLTDLCASYTSLSKDFYFITEKSALHESIRKFNNIVKLNLISKYSNDSPWLIDMGCGKGQDMLKYILTGIKNVLFIDVNENNLCEIINRKYGFCTNKKLDKKNIGIFIQNMDLNRNYLEILFDLTKSGIPLRKHDTKLIICNFAIHYLTNSTKQITNLARLVNSLLAVGGRFIFTCLDGKKVFDKLVGVNEWGDGTKYKIIKKYEKKMFSVGQMIDILLPFSNDTFYSEGLVNLESIEKQFSKHKLTIEATGGFEMFLEDFKKNNTELYDKLEPIDIEYIKMLCFNVYYKN